MNEWEYKGLIFELTGFWKQPVQHQYLWFLLGQKPKSMLIYILSLCSQSMKGGFPNLSKGGYASCFYLAHIFIAFTLSNVWELILPEIRVNRNLMVVFAVFWLSYDHWDVENTKAFDECAIRKCKSQLATVTLFCLSDHAVKSQECKTQ